MSLRHALLALLEAGPMTGYELAKQFDASAGYVWHAHHPQIYTELRRLEAEGLVEAEEAPRGAAATKRLYVVTDAGCDALLAWVAESDEPARERDPVLLKATYLEYGSFDVARGHLRRHRDHHRRMAAGWEAHADDLERRDTTLLRRRLAHSPRHAHEAIVAYKVHVYRGLSERSRGEVRWAEQGLELVDRLEADAGPVGDSPVNPPTPPERRSPAS
ncbi:transcriptional regulator [Actinomycetospora sp. NBRC 106375]|uniref:PadR family transcriptional regulator n=1 Tax=Actinomycetospora sp. NBRC 106375 TaxID=3032207 RepID=UPI0024A2F17D|nr:PadR family transcriptional regulator [Actinomycetospora sp. NBRC 106375]GLZ46115.1 transcriptional regulator [Actinomycetospora sp. NBRC 106375]